MPRRAVAAGTIDFVLRPGDIAREVARIARHPFAAGPTDDAAREDGDEAALASIFERLHAATGLDVARYKQTTIRRRVLRRMALAGLSSLEEYAARVRDDDDEADALGHDVLINVTSFFRDPTVFD